MDNLQLHFAPYCPFKMFLSRIINHYIYIELYVAGRRTGPVRGSAAVGAVSVFIWLLGRRREVCPTIGGWGGGGGGAGRLLRTSAQHRAQAGVKALTLSFSWAATHAAAADCLGSFQHCVSQQKEIVNPTGFTSRHGGLTIALTMQKKKKTGN